MKRFDEMMEKERDFYYTPDYREVEEGVELTISMSQQTKFGTFYFFFKSLTTVTNKEGISKEISIKIDGPRNTPPKKHSSPLDELCEDFPESASRALHVKHPGDRCFSFGGSNANCLHGWLRSG